MAIINALDFVVKRFGKLDIRINYAEHHVPISIRTVLIDLGFERNIVKMQIKYNTFVIQIELHFMKVLNVE